MLNGYEIVLILVLALIFFGAKKLPELARGLGKGIREFKRASRDVTNEIQNITEPEPYAPPKRSPPAPSFPETHPQEAVEVSASHEPEAARPPGS